MEEGGAAMKKPQKLLTPKQKVDLLNKAIEGLSDPEVIRGLKVLRRESYAALQTAKTKARKV